MAAADAERDAEAILAEVRRARPRPPRWLWVLAGLVGLGGAIAFAVAMLASPDPTAPQKSLPPPNTGVGFGAGLVIGLAIGLVLGLLIARQRRDHSSRNSP